MNRLLTLILIIALMISISGCSKDIDNTENISGENEEIEVSEDSNYPVVTILLNEDRKIIIELYPNIAENTVNNFISLVNDDFYDGLIFHRVISGFMIQGGCPDGTGMGGPGYSIKGEFKINDFENNLKHEAGVISMARSQHPDSAGSQFFIMHKDATHLDGKYAAFGKVIEGMDIVDSIANLKTGANDKPVNDIIIEDIVAELNGYEIKEVVKIK